MQNPQHVGKSLSQTENWGKTVKGPVGTPVAESVLVSLGTVGQVASFSSSWPAFPTLSAFPLPSFPAHDYILDASESRVFSPVLGTSDTGRW